MNDSTAVPIPRLRIGLNVLIQTLCVLFLVGVANFVAFQYYGRWDLSRSQKFSLADQTERVLKELKSPAKIIVFFSPSALGTESEMYRDVSNLLKEIQFVARKKVEIETVDPSRDLSRARELQAKYKFGANENVVIVDYEGRTKFVPVSDMGEFDMSGVSSGEPSRLVAFKGEQALTSALIALLNPEQKKVYFTQGHGEPPIDADAPLAILRSYIERQNVTAAPLNLATADSVPADAGAVFVIGPKYDFTKQETEVLRRYWEGQGRMIVLLDPDAATPDLSAALTNAGIEPLNNRVLGTRQLGVGVIGIVRDVLGTFQPGSQITKRLGGVNAFLPGATQTLKPDEARAARHGLTLRPLIAAADGYWGESDYADSQRRGVKFDLGKDVGTPVYIAFSVESGAVKDDRVDVARSKLVLVGNRDFATDEVLERAPANLDFLLSAMNWLLERNKLTGVAPKVISQFHLNLSDTEISRIAFYTMFVMPAAVAVIGLVVWWRRRV